MRLRRIRSRFSGYCKRCKASFSIGSEIMWSKETGALCLQCGANSETEIPTRTEWKSERKAQDSKGTRDFTIDWADLKEFARNVLENDSPPIDFLPENQSRIRSHILSPDLGFQGFGKETLLQWLNEGYSTDAIAGISDFIPPIREKRRFRFMEEGDEFHFDRAYSGEENYMSDWTKREVIPGIRVDVRFSISGGVGAQTIGDFNRWLCQMLYAIEASGIDAEINYVYDSAWTKAYPSHGIYRGSDRYIAVRVKKENETTDFLSISPMLSPAAYRTFLFSAATLFAEQLRIPMNPGMGMTNAKNKGRGWGVNFDGENHRIEITTPREAYSFPEAQMTEQLRASLKLLKG